VKTFRRNATLSLVCDSGYVAVSACILMLAFSFAPAMAFRIGATVVLAFAVVLLARAGRLDDWRVTACEAWQALDERERPVGHDGRRCAREHLEELCLRFAKSAAGIAIVLYAVSFLAAAHQATADTQALLALN
jgi:hypothetical protein